MSDSNQISIVTAPVPKPAKPSVPKSDPQNNPSVTKCWRAYQRAFRKKRADGESEFCCERAAKKAYLLATPDLSGYKNICDFIACASFAIINDIVSDKEGQQFLAAAKVALSALGHEPKQKPKSAA